MNIKLSKKISYEGQDYEEIYLDLESLRCQDLINSEEEGRLLDKDKFQLWGTKHICLIATRAANLRLGVIYALPAKDFMKIQMEIINFFSDVLSSASTNNNSDVPF